MSLHFIDATAVLALPGVKQAFSPEVAAAIANAIYHATGKRVRDLPLTINKLL